MNLLDIILEKELSTNEKPNKPLGNVAFADEDDDRTFAKLQGAKPGSEPDTDYEKMLYRMIDMWTTEPSDAMFDLNKNREKIKQFVKKYPTIFKPNVPKNTIMYRGVEDIGKKTMSQLRKSDLSDWTRLKEPYYLYKKPIAYTPRSPIQSWTYDFDTARQFSDEAMLLTNLNDEFIFNSNVFKVLFVHDEKEILHFGKEYTNKVYIAVHEFKFKDYIRNYILGRSKEKKPTSLKSINPKKIK